MDPNPAPVWIAAAVCSIANFHLPFQFSVLPVYWPYMWISAPPALIEDTSLSVYFCSGSYFLYDAFESTVIMTAAIREANASSTWNYTELFSCYDQECVEFYKQNVTNFLVTQLNFTSLQPNTLYSLEFLGCFYWRYFGSCTVEDSHYRYRVNITTKPEGELNGHP